MFEKFFKRKNAKIEEKEPSPQPVENNVTIINEVKPMTVFIRSKTFDKTKVLLDLDAKNFKDSLFIHQERAKQLVSLADNLIKDNKINTALEDAKVLEKLYLECAHPNEVVFLLTYYNYAKLTKYFESFGVHINLKEFID